MKQQADYANGKLFPLILRFSIPAAISLLITAIYNIVDRIFIGNFSGSTALAALSICFPLSFMMMAFGLMCSAGGSTLFTLFRGQQENKKANAAFGTAFFLTIFFELLLTAILLVFSKPLLTLFGVTETTYALALQYYNIVALGCVFQGLTLVFCDFVRVSGKPVLGMCVTGVGAITNILLDALFVVGFRWGVAGAAAATVIGQGVSTLFGGWLLFGGKTLVETGKANLRPDFLIGKKLLGCGFAFWIAQMAMGFIALVYNGQLGKYGGDVAISAYAVVSSVMTFIIMPASGISQGIQPIIGYNYGAGNYARVKQTFTQAALFSVGVTTVIWTLTECFPVALIHLFGGGELLEIGVPALRLNFMIAPVLGFVMLATTFFQSIGQPNASSIITLLRQVVALVPFIYILPRFLGTVGIFCAQPVSDFLATILSAVLMVRAFRKMPGTQKSKTKSAQA
ncbi:MAG: MATE family efflux transporter [Gemmiger sp.]|nr:MATE family efflux transporter [Gemmiger sp.]